MTIVFGGSKNSGKSTIATALNEQLGYKMLSGRDYEKLARSEEEAWREFVKLMQDESKQLLYILHDRKKYDELLGKPNVFCVKIKVPFETVCSSLCSRLGVDEVPGYLIGDLEDEYNTWADAPSDAELHGNGDISGIITAIRAAVRAKAAATAK